MFCKCFDCNCAFYTFLQIGRTRPQCRTHPVLRYTISKAATENIPGAIIKFIANYIKGRKAYTTYTHPDNVNLKLAFHKAVSFHPHYLTLTPQTYHHPVHRFRSWPMQMTSPNNLHSVYARPCKIYEQSGPKNKQHYAWQHTQRFWGLP